MSNLNSVMLKHEAAIGGKIFGKSIRSRQFYCLDENTWIWRQGRSTVVYKVNPTSIYKSNDGISYRLVGPQESKRLYQAAKAYNICVSRVYKALISLRDE